MPKLSKLNRAQLSDVDVLATRAITAMVADTVRALVKHGSPEIAPAFSCSPDDVGSVIAYTSTIYSEFGKADKQPLVNGIIRQMMELPGGLDMFFRALTILQIITNNPRCIDISRYVVGHIRRLNSAKGF